MSKLKELIGDFKSKGILTEESAKAITDEFDAIVDEKASIVKDHLKEEAKINAEAELAETLKTKEIELMEEAENYIEESLQSKLAEKIRLIEEQNIQYKSELQNEVLDTISTFVQDEVIPNIDSLVIEEGIRSGLENAKNSEFLAQAEQIKTLTEESKEKDEAIATLTSTVNSLNKALKSAKATNIAKRKSSMILAEEHKVARQASRKNRKLKEEAYTDETGAEWRAKKAGNDSLISDISNFLSVATALRSKGQTYGKDAIKFKDVKGKKTGRTIAGHIVDFDDAIREITRDEESGRFGGEIDHNLAIARDRDATEKAFKTFKAGVEDVLESQADGKLTIDDAKKIIAAKSNEKTGEGSGGHNKKDFFADFKAAAESDDDLSDDAIERKAKQAAGRKRFSRGMKVGTEESRRPRRSSQRLKEESKESKFTAARQKRIIEEAKRSLTKPKKENKKPLSEFVEESVSVLPNKQAIEVKRRLSGMKRSEIESNINSVIRKVVEESLRAKKEKRIKMIEESKKPITRNRAIREDNPGRIIKDGVDQSRGFDPYAAASSFMPKLG
jgi:hypothetical protein